MNPEHTMEIETELTPAREAIHGTSEEVRELFRALAACQGEIQPAKTDQRNAFENYDYADYGSFRRAVRGALEKHKLAVLHLPTQTRDPLATVGLRTIVCHEGGGWIETVSEIGIYGKPSKAGPGKKDEKAVGSSMTYLAKYHLRYVLGVAAGVGDDPDSYGDGGERAGGESSRGEPRIQRRARETRSARPQAPTPPPPSGGPDYGAF